jgi:hypothetical protein
MSVTDAIKNQVVGRAARALTSNLVGVQGNLPGRARRGPIPGNTGGIEAPGAASINLSYPLNVEGDEQQGHYMMFMINKATSGTVAKKGSKKKPSKGQDAATGFQGKKFISEHLNKGAGKDTEQFRRAPPEGGLHQSRPGTTRMEKAITLYMPPSVKVSYKSNYKDDEISARASAIGDTVKSVIDVMSGKDQGLGGLAKIGKVLKTAGKGAGAVAAFAGKAMAETAAPGAVTLAQLSTGAILGNKMEVMFTDVGRRNFSFAFNFIPKSEQEAQMVYKIVQTFKEHMLPEYLAGFKLPGGNTTIPLGAGRVLSIPDTFDIFYFYHNNENPFLNRISTCYLTSLDIDYGGDKYVTYEPTELGNRTGPPPQKTAISLAFTEIETITRERAREGF